MSLNNPQDQGEAPGWRSTQGAGETQSRGAPKEGEKFKAGILEQINNMIHGGEKEDQIHGIEKEKMDKNKTMDKEGGHHDDESNINNDSDLITLRLESRWRKSLCWKSVTSPPWKVDANDSVGLKNLVSEGKNCQTARKLHCQWVYDFQQC